MMIDPEELREIRDELAVFRRAAGWVLPSDKIELDDEVLEEAVSLLKLPSDVDATGSDYKVLPVERKLNLNDLHEDTRDIISAYACYSPIVRRYISVVEFRSDLVSTILTV